MDGGFDKDVAILKSRGIRFPIDDDVLPPRIRRTLRAGNYELKESEAVLRVVDAGETVLELGAGIGYMSSLIATKKDVKKVVSYEANPNLIPYIHRVHEGNGITNTEVRNALLSPRAGKPVPFYIRQNFLGSSMTLDDDPNTVIDTVEIPQHGISPTLKELKPDVLVCDIEGAEATLLPAGDWSCLRAAVIELHPQWIGQSGVQAVFDAMHKAGLTYAPKASHGKVVTFRKGW